MFFIKKKKIWITASIVLVAVILFILLQPSYSIYSFIPHSPGTIIEIDPYSSSVENNDSSFKILKTFFPALKGCIQIIPDDEKEISLFSSLNIGIMNIPLKILSLFAEKDTKSELYFFYYKKEKIFFKLYYNILLISNKKEPILNSLDRINSQNTILHNKEYIVLKKSSHNTGIFMFSDIYNSIPPAFFSSFPLPLNIPLKSFAADIIIISNEIKMRFYMPSDSDNSAIFSSMSALISSITFFTSKKETINNKTISYVPSSSKDVEFAFYTVKDSLHIGTNRTLLSLMVDDSNSYMYPVYFYGDHIFSNYLIYSLCEINNADPKPFLDKIDALKGELFSETDFFNFNLYIRPTKTISELLEIKK